MRDYYKQLCANKMENLEEMDKFLEKHNLLRLNQEKIENINRPITSIEIETVIKKSSNKQKPRTKWFHWWILSDIYFILFVLFIYFCSSSWVTCRLIIKFIFLYSRFLLVIHFVHISVCMSIPTAQFITPPHRSFPPLVSICPFSTSVSQLLPCKAAHLYHFSRFHIHALIYDMWGFPGGAVVKNPPASAGDMGSIPGPGRPHMPRSY